MLMLRSATKKTKQPTPRPSRFLHKVLLVAIALVTRSVQA